VKNALIADTAAVAKDVKTASPASGVAIASAARIASIALDWSESLG
jgi:hypothetical protein